MVHFGKVVVLGGQRENRDDRQTAGGDFLRDAQRRQRFVNRVTRPGEQSHLLSCDDGRGAARQAVNILKNGRAAAETAVLLAQDLHQASASIVAEGHFARGRPDAFDRGRMAEELGHAGEIFEVGGVEGSHVRNSVRREAFTLHQTHHDTWGAPQSNRSLWAHWLNN